MMCATPNVVIQSVSRKGHHDFFFFPFANMSTSSRASFCPPPAAPPRSTFQLVQFASPGPLRCNHPLRVSSSQLVFPATSSSGPVSGHQDCNRRPSRQSTFVARHAINFIPGASCRNRKNPSANTRNVSFSSRFTAKALAFREINVVAILQTSRSQSPFSRRFPPSVVHDQ